MQESEVARWRCRPDTSRHCAAGFDNANGLDGVGGRRTEDPLPKRQKPAVWGPGRPIDIGELIVSRRLHFGFRTGKLADEQGSLAVKALADECQSSSIRRPDRRP